MNTVSDFLSRMLRGVLKLVLVLAATVLIVSFLLAALVAVLVMSLWSLVTGRKPTPVVVFSRMRAQSQRYTQGMWPGRAPAGDVVEVQATVVNDSHSSEAPPQRLH